MGEMIVEVANICSFQLGMRSISIETPEEKYPIHSSDQVDFKHLLCVNQGPGPGVEVGVQK